MVGRRVIRLVHGGPGKARIFHLVGIDFSIGIGKTGFGHRLGVVILHFHWVAIRMGTFLGPIQVRWFIEIANHKNRSRFVRQRTYLPEQPGNLSATRLFCGGNRLDFSPEKRGVFVFMPLWLNTQKLIRI